MNKLLIAVSLSMLSSVAFAADPIFEEVAPGFSWTGGYVGVHAGYDWAAMDHTELDIQDRFTANEGGFIGGAYVGYNYQIDSFVLGGEADFGFTDISAGPNVGAENNDYTAFDSNWNAHVRGRLGYAMDRTLFFVAGGLAIADLTSDDTDPGWGSNSSTYVGWTIGAGAEHAVTDNFIIRAEYLYDDYGSKDFTIDGPDPYLVGASMTASTVRLGFAYKFR